jgi:uncharacterized protein (TIGR03067 family)
MFRCPILQLCLILSSTWIAAGDQAPTLAKDLNGDPLPPFATTARLGTLRWRHADVIHFAAFLPDGKFAIQTQFAAALSKDANVIATYFDSPVRGSKKASKPEIHLHDIGTDKELVVAGVAGLVGWQNDASKEDQRRLEGDWKVLSVVVDGKDAFKKDGTGLVWSIKDGKITYGETYPGYDVIDLDASKSPKTVNGKRYTSKGDGKATLDMAFKGIYKIEGDSFSLCLDISDKVYPPSFESKPGSGFRLTTLSRVKK